ncbi:MAG: response regulator transcription factor [Campylobacterota bacterium]|nr:response regulator transcription factor [Campylobacterota bacterium]
MSKKNIEIVIIEDEEDILELVEYHLDKEGYSATGFLSTQNVEQFIEEEAPSLLIVDRNLPDREGGEFVSYLREAGYDTPVIFLTAKDKEKDLIEGFQYGGDDYITKPFSTAELLLRVKSLLKRSGMHDEQTVKYKDMTLYVPTRTLSIENEIIRLTNLEFRLLHTFVKNPQQALDRDYLRDEVWSSDGVDFHDKTINVAINRLRKKIDPLGEKAYFSPVWGIGYMLA